jgi:class 3 adenylate cyclase/CHASE2 domain-containing sensor protein
LTALKPFELERGNGLTKQIGNDRNINIRRAILGIVLVIFSFSTAEVVTHVGWLDAFEYTFYDLWHCLSGRRAEPRHTVIVAVDDQAFLEHPDEPLVFWGPYFARVIGNVRRAGARIIGLDYLFSVSAESWLKKLEGSGSDKGRIHDIPMRKQLASGQVVLIASMVSLEQEKGQLLLPINDYLFALPGGPADLGLGNFYADQDGMVRRFFPTLFDDGTMPSLTFATLLSVRAAGLKPTSSSWSLGGREIPNSILPQAVGFVGPPGTIPRLSFSQLLNSRANEEHEIQYLKDKVVIITAEYLGNQDIHLTPYAHGFLGLESRMMSGAELHANIIETLLTGRFPRSAPSWLRLLYSAIVLTIGIALFFRLNPWWGLGAGLVLILVCTVLAFLFFQTNLVLPVASIYFGMSVGYLGALGFRLTGEERERIRLRQMFGRYVSDEVVEKLLTIGHRPDQQGESLKVTVLFSDIRNFTTISEKLTPHEVVKMLNAYFSRVCEPIWEEGGTVDKFIGDAVMAVFGSPVPYEDHAQRALRAALAMSELAREFRFWMNEHFAHIDLPEFEIGIGLHTGEAVLGSIGSPKRMEFTAIGDTVNTASRLEGLTKELGWTIVASSDTIHAASSTASTGKRQEISVKGREGHIEVFEVIGLKPEKGGAQ